MADMSPDYRRVCEALPQLSREELADLRRRATFLMGGRAQDGEAQQPARDDRDWLLRGIEDELRRRGVTGRRPLVVDRILPSSWPWAEVSAAARSDLTAALGAPPDPRQLAALGQLAARCLATLLESRDIPVGPRTMLRSADRTMEAVDAQFPGYAARGLLHCALQPDLVGGGRM